MGNNQSIDNFNQTGGQLESPNQWGSVAQDIWKPPALDKKNDKDMTCKDLVDIYDNSNPNTLVFDNPFPGNDDSKGGGGNDSGKLSQEVPQGPSESPDDYSTTTADIGNRVDSPPQNPKDIPGGKEPIGVYGINNITLEKNNGRSEDSKPAPRDGEIDNVIPVNKNGSSEDSKPAQRDEDIEQKKKEEKSTEESKEKPGIDGEIRQELKKEPRESNNPVEEGQLKPSGKPGNDPPKKQDAEKEKSEQQKKDSIKKEMDRIADILKKWTDPGHMPKEPEKL